MRIRVNFRPNLNQLFHPLTRSHGALCDADKSCLQVLARDRNLQHPQTRLCASDFILHITVVTCYRLPATVMQEAPSEAIDRRPIATRNRKWAQSSTAWLASRNVSPNAISV